MMFGNGNWGIGRVEWLEVLLSGFGCVWKEAVAPGKWSSSLGPRMEGVHRGVPRSGRYLEAPTLPFGPRFWEWQRHIAFCRNVVFCVISVGIIDLHPHSKTCHADLTVFKGNSMAIPSHPPFFQGQLMSFNVDVQ